MSMSYAGFAWSEHTINRMAEMWQAGVSTIAIGRALGTSKNSVVGKSHRLYDEGDQRFTPRPSPIRRGSESSEPAAPKAKTVTLPRLPSETPNNIAARHKANVNILPTEPETKSVPTDEEPVIFMPPARPPEPIPPPRQFRLPPCCWPIGEPGRRDFRFCGDPAVALGRPYCAEHSARAYVKIRTRHEEQQPTA